MEKQAETVGPLGALENFFRHYARFQGRSSRSEYWWMWLWSPLFNVGVFLPALFFGTPFQWLGEILFTVFFISALGVIPPSLAVTARRLADAGFSPNWFFLLLLGFFGAVPVWIMCALRMKPDSENVGEAQNGID